MALTRTQAVSANTTTATITTPTVNDLILVFAYNANSATAPSAANLYTDSGSATVGTTAARVGFKLSAGTETNCGTWTNATNVVCHVYRGYDLDASLNVAGGLVPFTTNAGSTSISFPTYAGITPSGNDWIVAFAAANSATSGFASNTTGGTVLTHTTNQITIGGWDTNAGVASYSTTSLTIVTSSPWISTVFNMTALIVVPDLIQQPLVPAGRR
jgi:hypothetical protein